jgi:phage shock protein PspC (stress-responsive transcriptional regulator)
MKKATQINLVGQLIHIDEDAYGRLKGYLEELHMHLRGTEGCDEILADIEMRLAELLMGRLGNARQVVDLSDVEWVVNVLGRPNDFSTSDTQATGASPASDWESGSTTRRLLRDTDGILLGGVCMGLSTYLRMDVAFFKNNICFTRIIYRFRSVFVYHFMGIRS